MLSTAQRAVRASARAVLFMLVLAAGAAVSASAAIAAGGTLVPAATSLDFGSAAITSTVIRTVEIQNTGPGDVFFNGESVTASSGFGLALASDTCFNHTIPAGGSCTAAVSFTPSAIGPASATFSIFSDGVPSPIQISLNGTGTAQLVASAGSIDFGSTAVTTTLTRTVQITNNGAADVFFNGEAVTASSGFGLALGTDTCFNHTIHTGESCLAAVSFSPTAVGPASATFSLYSTGTPSPLQIALSGTGTPQLVAATTSLSFGSVVVSGSATQTVQITNNGAADVFFNGESVTASSGFGLALGTDTCFNHTLHTGESCLAAVTFAPSTIGPATATFSLFSTGTPSPLQISLTGTGTPNLVLASPSLNFGSHAIGTRTDQSVAVQNVGTADITVTGEFASGGDFWLSPADTCLGRTLHPGDSCQLGAQFFPTALGTRTGSVSMQSNGAPSPLTLSLTGVGTPNLVASPTSVDFGSTAIASYSAPHTVTLSNLGTTPVSLDSFTVSAPFLIAANSCGSSLAGGATCDVTLQFHPDALGTRLGSLHVATNAAGGPVDVALSGVGTTSPALAALSTAGHDFGSQGIGTQGAAFVFLVTDSGPGPIAINTVSLSGANPGDFAVLSDSCSGVTLSQGGACAVSVAFGPTAAGSRTANLVVTHSGSNSPLSAGLSGTGVASSVRLSATALDFKNTKVGSTSPSKTLTLTNDGPGTLTISGAAISGSAASDFQITGNTCTGVTLAVGGTCTITLTFAPTATGDRAATLTITDNGTTTTQSVSLTGTGVGGKKN